jgi:hypothetical protein
MRIIAYLICIGVVLGFNVLVLLSNKSLLKYQSASLILILNLGLVHLMEQLSKYEKHRLVINL